MQTKKNEIDFKGCLTFIGFLLVVFILMGILGYFIERIEVFIDGYADILVYLGIGVFILYVVFFNVKK